MKKSLTIVLLAFCLVAAYTAGRQLGHRFSTVVLGVFVGIAVSLPLNLLTVVLARHQSLANGRDGQTTPMIVYTPPVMSLQRPSVPEKPLWDGAQPWVQPARREFRALGGEEIVDE